MQASADLLQFGAQHRSGGCPAFGAKRIVRRVRIPKQAVLQIGGLSRWGRTGAMYRPTTRHSGPLFSGSEESGRAYAGV